MVCGSNFYVSLSLRPVKYVWHGSNKYGETSHNYNCNAWSSSSARVFGMASSLASLKLLGQKKVPCDNRLIVLCIETSSTLPKRRKREALTEGEILDQELQEGLQFDYQDPEEEVEDTPYEGEGQENQDASDNVASSSSSGESVTTAEVEDHIEVYKRGDGQQAKPPSLVDDLVYEI